MTKREIILDTVEYYKNNDRARTSSSCQYLTEDGRMCAVGRCLINPKDIQSRYPCNGAHVIANACAANNESFNDLFKPEYRGHGYTFWTDIQILHDQSQHWDGRKLSPIGVQRVEKLMNKYAENYLVVSN